MIKIGNKEYLNLQEAVLNNAIDIELLKRTPAAYLGSCRYKLPEIHENKEVYVHAEG